MSKTNPDWKKRILDSARALKESLEERTKNDEKDDQTKSSVFAGELQPSPIEKCVIDPELFGEITGFLQSREEFGGFLIGEYENEKTAKIYAAVFPPQTQNSATYCEFQSAFMAPAITLLEESGLTKYGVVAWIHSHPGLGFFLSGTDRKTFEPLIRRNPKLLAVVVDSFNDEKAAVFANKSTSFDTTRVAFEITPQHLDEEAIFVLNMLKIKLYTSRVMVPRHRFRILVDSIADIAKRSEKTDRSIGAIASMEQQIDYLMTTGIRRIESVESLVHLKECPKCKRTYTTRRTSFCPMCGTELVNK